MSAKKKKKKWIASSRDRKMLQARKSQILREKPWMRESGFRIRKGIRETRYYLYYG